MKHLRQKALASAIAALPLVNHAAPQDGVVVAGSAVIRQETPTKIGITQTTDRAIIDWRSYSIGVNEHVQYYQPSAASAILNRVTGQDPSQILGRLTANGQVFLVNPNGIYFGRNAQIDVAGLVASTHNIRNADFMAGNYTFDIPGKPGASVINEGAVRIADTGIAAFVAPSVANRGIVAARLGKVAMAAANGFTLDFTGDNLLSFMVNDEVAQTAFDLEGNRLTSFVENSGKIEAQGGFVLLTAKAAENAIHGVINHSGVIEATSVGKQNGEIILAGGQHGAVAITGSLDASGKGAGETGGKVQVTGNAIALDSGTRIDVSGNLGGGKVIVGGDYLGGSASNEQLAAHGMTREPGDIQTATSVTVSEGAIIDASALLAGNGGKVVVWANDTLHYDGKIYARGGMLSGHGGVVETSGKENLYVRGTVDAGAANGRGGLWFLDPIDVVVANSGGTVLPSVIASALNTGTVYTVRATSDRRPGSITVLDDIRKTAGGTATLELITNGAVILNRGGRIVSTSGKLNVKIDARKEVADPGYNLVAIGNDTAYAIETNGGQVDITGLIQTYQGKAIKTNGGQVLARTTPTENDSDTRGFIGIGPVPLNDTSAYTIDAGNGKVNMRATGGTITLDDHAIKGNTVLLRGDVYARPNILSFNMADEASRQRIERNFGGASGYGTNFPSNDDDSIPVSITSLAGTGLTLLGRDFGETIYLSNNGYIRLDTRDGTYTPYPLNSTNNPIIAAYFGDVDTRGAGNVYYATRATANDNKVALTWIGTGYFSRGTDKTNTFQLQVENLGVETNMRFSYQQLQWTTGSASGGSNGLGGTVARAGFAIPGRNETIRFELPSSGRETDMLALASLPGNTGKVGVWSFRLWPEATPPNRNNGRFEVAANTLTVNGNSSGHQLERGAPGSSNVENVDRRRTEDYLSRLLVSKFAYQGQIPDRSVDDGEKPDIPTPRNLAEALTSTHPKEAITSYLISQGVNVAVGGALGTIYQTLLYLPRTKYLKKLFDERYIDTIRDALGETLGKPGVIARLKHIAADAAGGTLKGAPLDALIALITDDIKVRLGDNVITAFGVDVIAAVLKQAYLSDGSIIKFKAGIAIDIATLTTQQVKAAYDARQELVVFERNMNSSFFELARLAVDMAAKPNSKDLSDDLYKSLTRNYLDHYYEGRSASSDKRVPSESDVRTIANAAVEISLLFPKEPTLISSETAAANAKRVADLVQSVADLDFVNNFDRVVMLDRLVKASGSNIDIPAIYGNLKNK